MCKGVGMRYGTGRAAYAYGPTGGIGKRGVAQTRQHAATLLQQ